MLVLLVQLCPCVWALIGIGVFVFLRNRTAKLIVNYPGFVCVNSESFEICADH